MIVLLLVLVLVMSCNGRNPPPIRLVGQGTIIGRELSRARTQKIFAYLGIPYAAPPLDRLRFAPPEEPLSWDGVRNATEFGPACLQTRDDFREEALPFLQLLGESEIVMDEDCLYLNVFVPQEKPPPEGFATIIWFHPGNFTTGTTTIWNPHSLVYRHHVIIVTMAYRLSIMGFFTSLDGEAPGNYGLMDQQLAMRWVKNNIKSFGGDPDNICLMGYGTGGVSVALQLINPQSRDLFAKAIIMSANFINPSAVKQPDEDREWIEELAANFGCNRRPTSELLECLRHAESADLIQFSWDVNWRPLIDAGLSNSTPPFLPDLPRTFLDSGDFAKVPLLIGYTDMEEMLTYKNFTNSDTNLMKLFEQIISLDYQLPNATDCGSNTHAMDAVRFFYEPLTDADNITILRKVLADFTTEKNYGSQTVMLANLFSAYQPTYVYRFGKRPTTEWAVENIPEWVSVPHLFDLVYLWGMPFWIYDGKLWSVTDKSISDVIMSFWTNFARSSNPTQGLSLAIRWDAYTKNDPKILMIDGTFNMSSSNNLNYKAFEFWNNYFPKVLQMGRECCNGFDSAVNLNFQQIPFIFIIFTSCIFNIFR